MKRPIRLFVSRAASGLAVALLAAVAACADKTEKPVGSGSDPLADIDRQSDRPRDVRPPPASSGIRSDPDNPAGLPGPSRGLGISSNRY